MVIDLFCFLIFLESVLVSYIFLEMYPSNLSFQIYWHAGIRHFTIASDLFNICAFVSTHSKYCLAVPSLFAVMNFCKTVSFMSLQRTDLWFCSSSPLYACFHHHFFQFILFYSILSMILISLICSLFSFF